MKPAFEAKWVQVIDARGRKLAPCDARRAQKLLATGRAIVASENPLSIQLHYEAHRPPANRPSHEPIIAPGTPLLLHICCGPCATYPVPRLRELGFSLVGWWYNPNIQPVEEHSRRETSAQAYAAQTGLTLLSGPYEPDRFESVIRSHEQRPERCLRCYRLRLEETARKAKEQDIETITTTLLISPYQDQTAIREIGEGVASRYGRRFFFENLRRGWTQRGSLARAYGLFQQQYCGCRFSLAERERAIRKRSIPPAAEER